MVEVKSKKVLFSFHAFILAFCSGLLYVYLFTPHKQIVVKYPNPFNAEKLVYSDSTDGCYKYKANKVDCPADKSKILEHPVV